MKFIVSSSYLLKELQVLGGIINNNNTLPILDNFLFNLDSNSLTVSASDLETTISSVLEVESTDRGNVCISAKLLLETLKTFPEQPLTFTVSDNTVEISSEHGKYTLAYADAEDFPKAIELNDSSSLKIQGDILANAISKTIFASGNDDMRPVMNGVFFQFSTEKLIFVATDAHKLVRYTRDDISAPETAEFIMPKKPLNLLKNILMGNEEDVTIEYTDTNTKFSFGNTEMICRLIDGKYPNYEAVIPVDNPNKLLIGRTRFLNSVRRISIFSSKSSHQIRLKLAGAELNISAEDADFSNRAEERLTCDYQGDDLEIGFNSRFLLEMLGNLNSDEVSLEMSYPNRAGILTPVDGLDEGENITMLVMPVMLN